MWDGIFAQARAGLLSGEADLARAEAELGFRLPPSYRGFAQTFGAGTIGSSLRIFTPVPVAEADLVARAHLMSHAVAAAIDGLAANPLTRDAPHRFAIEGEADAALMERACFFGQGADGSFLFFDVAPEAGTRAEERAGEYDIWVLSPDLETVRYGEADLVGLVRRLLEGADGSLLGEGAEPLPSAFEGDAAAALSRLADGDASA